MSTSPRRFGKYELQERLGRGGMGEVWKALDTQLQRHVAIKFLHADLQNDPSFITRFQREAQVIASLHHPNIVKVYDFQVSQPPESESTTAYMVMDYVEGQTLAHYIRNTSRIGKFPPAVDIIHLLTPISMAIDYAHQKGMIHRDIKPANILLDKRNTTNNPMGEPILTDFGIAKLIGASTGTLSAWWFGTPHYTSPEQAKGLPGNERSDLYSLGIIIYEICTGVLPFHGDNPAAIMVQHINAMPTSPAIINPNISPALTVAILRSLDKDPAVRFANAASMVAALAEAFNLPVPEVLRSSVIPTNPLSGPMYPHPVQYPLPLNVTPPLSPQVAAPPSPFMPVSGSTLPASGPSGTPFLTPAIPSLHPSMQDGGRYFMVQEYVGGENLEERMNRLNQPMEEREALVYASQVLDILNGLEQQTPPVVHGDIKPANILIGARDRRARLIGFGDAARNTPRQQVLVTGTPGYAPLEQFQGNMDPRSDLYALAATLHHVLTNRNPRNYPPFVYPLARFLNPQLSPEVERLLVRGLTNDISQRYQSSAEMKRDVDDILLRRYGVASSNDALAMPGSTEAGGVKSTENASAMKKVATRVNEWLGQPGAGNSAGSTSQPISIGQSMPMQQQSLPGLQAGGPASGEWQGLAQQAAGMYSGPPQQQRRSNRRRNIVLASLLILVLIIAGLSTLLSLRNTHTVHSTPTPTAPGNGIGVTRAADGEYIGVSDGTFAFDTSADRTDRDLKRQAADKLKAGDVGSAQTLWQSAVTQDTNDAEALIYMEDQRVLASGYPYITLVVGTMITGTDAASVGRGDLQGAYVAQKEYNEGFKLPGTTQVRLLIANTGNDKLYAKTVAQQIVQAARADKTIVGVMGWPYSSRTLNAINALSAAHIPTVSQSATSLLLNGISPYFFRIVPPDSAQATAGAKYAEQTLHVKAAALFVDPTDAYSKSLADAFKQQFTADGNSIVVTEQYTETKPGTLSASLQDALSHNPDVIYFSGYATDATTILTDLPTSGRFANLLVMGGDGLFQGYSSSARANLGRLRMTTFAYADEWGVQGLDSQKPSFFREFKQFFNPASQPHATPYGYDRPGTEQMEAFDATFALLEASKIALTGGKKTFTSDDLRQALTTITGAQAIQGVCGQIAFGPDGNPLDKAVLVLSATKEGFFQLASLQGRFLK